MGALGFGVFWFGLKLAFSRNVMDLLIVWRGARVGKRRKHVWGLWAMIPLCLMWIIWREKNMRCFEKVDNTLFRIKVFWLVACVVGTRERNPSLDQFFHWLDIFHSLGSV